MCAFPGWNKKFQAKSKGVVSEFMIASHPCNGGERNAVLIVEVDCKENTRILMTLEKRRGHAVFGFPGGKLNRIGNGWEDPLKAAHREFEEETGQVLESTQYILLSEFTRGDTRFFYVKSTQSFTLWNDNRKNTEILAIELVRTDVIQKAFATKDNTCMLTVGDLKARMRKRYILQVVKKKQASREQSL
jgi:ADP-ribose pyrophosphatase YjhB (NUDIX family)